MPSTLARFLFLPATLAVAAAIACAIGATKPYERYLSPHTDDFTAAQWTDAELAAGRSIPGVATLPAINTTSPQFSFSAPPPAAYLFGNSACREAIDAPALTAATGILARNYGLTSITLSEYKNALPPMRRGDHLVLVLNGPFLDDRCRKDTDLPWNRPDTLLPYVAERRRGIAAIITSRLRTLARMALGRPVDPVDAGQAPRLHRYDDLPPLSADKLAASEKELLDLYADDGKDHAAANLAALGELCKQSVSDGWNLYAVWLPSNSAAVDARFTPHLEAARKLLAANEHLLWTIYTPYDMGNQPPPEKDDPEGTAEREKARREYWHLLPNGDAPYPMVEFAPEDFYDTGHMRKSGREKYMGWFLRDEGPSTGGNWIHEQVEALERYLAKEAAKGNPKKQEAAGAK